MNYAIVFGVGSSAAAVVLSSENSPLSLPKREKKKEKGKKKQKKSLKFFDAMYRVINF